MVCGYGDSSAGFSKLERGKNQSSAFFLKKRYPKKEYTYIYYNMYDCFIF